MTKLEQTVLAKLLAELRYVQNTGDIRDSLRNSNEVREEAAKLLGYTSYAAYDEECEND